MKMADAGTGHRVARSVGEWCGNAGLAQLLHQGSAAAVQRSGGAAPDEADGEMRRHFGLDPGDLEELSEGDAPPASSGTKISVVDSPYSVSGTFLQVANQLAARSEAGSVTSQVSDIHLHPVPGPVRLASISVTETVSLPTWSDRPQASAGEKAEWDRFRAALAAHEQGHVGLDRAAFTDIHKRCLGVTETIANERIDAAIEAASAANGEFDSSTDHGRSAGTSINTNVAETKPPASP
jgi:hypothetical protein